MKTPWDTFFEEKVTKIFTEKKLIIDIGGGLRIDDKRQNRKSRNSWITKFLPNVEYKILDKVPDYNPDYVGDVHKLPFADNSVDAIFAICLLEHVEEPQVAVKEIYRVLKPGGYCFVHVPFLFSFHPMKGYYDDFYRFTSSGMKYLMRDFKNIELQNRRGALATVAHLVPPLVPFEKIFVWLDSLISKTNTEQTSEYMVFAQK